MYFTKSGSMQYYQGFDERQPVDVDGGDYTWLAEPALWLVWLHLGRAFALTNCEFLKLPAGLLHKALLSNPSLGKMCTEYARLFCSRIGAVMTSKAEPLGSQQEPRLEEAALSDLHGLHRDVLLELAHMAFSHVEPDAEINGTLAPASTMEQSVRFMRRMSRSIL
mmetsp:Transcript_65124/g.180645  ORF Transcript_65124/g.180645 Transcript_65124/m.180645 type:complete len:165 (+) Transcript_65124:1-495(+)